MEEIFYKCIFRNFKHVRKIPSQRNSRCKGKSDCIDVIYLLPLGSVDIVCCHMCGVEMGRWSADEDVWVRHARQSPDCQFLLQEKGEPFVTSTLDEYGRYVACPRTQHLNVRSKILSPPSKE